MKTASKKMTILSTYCITSSRKHSPRTSTGIMWKFFSEAVCLHYRFTKADVMIRAFETTKGNGMIMYGSWRKIKLLEACDYGISKNHIQNHA
jgi:hypothetical protein